MKLGFNPQSAYGVGVDIGGTKIFIVVTDLEGNIIHKERRNATSNVMGIINMIKETIKGAGIDERDVAGIGIGVPSIVDSQRGIVVDAPALGWRNLAMLDLMQQHFLAPLYLGNDVNFAALGERWLGAGDKTDNMFFIAIGTGVGSAILANGELVEGHHYDAGEIGYFLNVADVKADRSNSFGEFGIFEKKTSGTALSAHGYTSYELFERFGQGEPDAVSIIEEFLLEVCVAIANVVSLLNPEKVVIGGGVCESLTGVIDRIHETVARLTPIETTVQLARLGGEAGGLGAIAYAFQKIQENELGANK